MVLVSSHQPNFLPWAGFWYKVFASDHFVMSYGVDWSLGDYSNRCKHMGAWLTVPVGHTHLLPMYRVLIAGDGRIVGKLIKTLEQERGAYKDRLTGVIDIIHREAQAGTSVTQLNSRLISEIGLLISANRHGLGQVNTIIHNSYALRDYAKGKVENLYTHLKEAVPLATSYVAGPGTFQYLTDLGGFPLPVLRQIMVRDLTERSIVQLIAQEPDPYDVIMSSFRLEAA